MRVGTSVALALASNVAIAQGSGGGSSARAPARDGSRRPAPACHVDVVEKSIPELQDAMAHKSATSAQLVDAYLARIAAYDVGGPRLQSVIRLDPTARAQAAALDAERRAGHVRGPMHGIPILLKDNYSTAGQPTSGGAIALAGLVPKQDAFVVAKLREAGAVILGKTNMHELAAGILTVSSLGGQTRNPYDPERIPGGSSGGTAVASAASFAAIAYGSDTCGSIRIPSAFDDLFGLRPTKGVTSITGIIPLSHTQDVVGPLARTVTDLAIGLDAIVGRDPADDATRILDGASAPSFVASLDSLALRGARLGVVRAWFGNQPEDAEASEIIGAALEAMKKRGATIVDIAPPIADSIVTRASVIDYEFKYDLMDFLAANSGASVGSLHDILAKGMHDIALTGAFTRRDTTGTRDSDAYRAALARRVLVRNAVVAVLDSSHLDALVYPTSRRSPPLVGEPPWGTTCLVSAVSGLPALAAPAGFTERGLPIGFEMLGRPLADARLVSLGYGYERVGGRRRIPPYTPKLVNGKPPAPEVFTAAVRASEGARATARFHIDSASGRTRYEMRISGAAPREVFATVLSRASADGRAVIVHRLAGPEMVATSGTLDLDAKDREALVAGRLGMILFTRRDSLGTNPAALSRKNTATR